MGRLPRCCKLMAKKKPKKTDAPPAAEAAEDAAPGPAPQAEVERLEAELAQCRDSLARAQAELANVLKRHEREREAARLYRVEPLARSLLELADAMEEAQQAMAQEENVSEALREGQALTLRSLMRAFEQYAIEAIDPAGEPFDPNLHEAVAAQPTAAVPPGRVLEVLRKGYRLHERLLRPARVVVSAAEAEEAAADKASEPGPDAADPS